MENFGEAAILCGGKSRRMGFDKSLATVNGVYVIEAIRARLRRVFPTVRLCIGTKERRERFGRFGLDLVEDATPGGGPAVAILAALSRAGTRYVFVTGCDMPLPNPEHIAYMKERIAGMEPPPDAFIPRNGPNIEPLYGFYSVAAVGSFRRELEAGRHKLQGMLDGCDTAYLEEEASRKFDRNLAMFTNLNYKEDFDGFSYGGAACR